MRRGAAVLLSALLLGACSDEGPPKAYTQTSSHTVTYGVKVTGLEVDVVYTVQFTGPDGTSLSEDFHARGGWAKKITLTKEAYRSQQVALSVEIGTGMLVQPLMQCRVDVDGKPAGDEGRGSCRVYTEISGTAAG